MVRYDAFYLLNTNKILEYFQFQYFAKPIFENGIICIPPKNNEPHNDFVWSGQDCEIERNRLFCDLCKHDGATRLYGSPSHGSLALHGSAIAESFVPCYEIIVTEPFVESLKHTEFSGYECFPLEFFSYTNRDQPNMFLLECKGNAYDQSDKNIFAKYPDYCVNCHWGPQICPECHGVVTECPNCRSKDFACDVEFPEELLLSQRIELPYFDGMESYFPLSCEWWDGTDFINGQIISGRVAKWLVENEHGPVFLLPYPADISKCSEEQLERINKVRYNYSQINVGD